MKKIKIEVCVCAWPDPKQSLVILKLRLCQKRKQGLEMTNLSKLYYLISHYKTSSQLCVLKKKKPTGTDLRILVCFCHKYFTPQIFIGH